MVLKCQAVSITVKKTTLESNNNPILIRQSGIFYAKIPLHFLINEVKCE